jgi:hypothetical protein
MTFLAFLLVCIQTPPTTEGLKIGNWNGEKNARPAFSQQGNHVPAYHISEPRNLREKWEGKCGRLLLAPKPQQHTYTGRPEYSHVNMYV